MSGGLVNGAWTLSTSAQEKEAVKEFKKALNSSLKYALYITSYRVIR